MRIGVIGCGRIATKHLHAYGRLPDVEIIVADDIPDLARAAASAHHVGWRHNAQALLEDESVDAIDVCVPTSAHAPLVISALQAGKHVFCEKPLCRSREEGQAIAEAQRSAGKVLMVGYLYRLHPGYRRLKEVLERGALGRPHLALLRFGGRGGTADWKHQAESGGGAALELLVHGLDMALWLLGPATSCEVLDKSTLLPIRTVNGRTVHATAEDYVLVRLRVGACVILCESDLVTPSYMNHAEIHGDNGSGFTSILDYFPTAIFCNRSHGGFAAGYHIEHYPAVNLFELELAAFVASLRGERPATDHINESLLIVDQLEGIMQAAVR
ncbi:MAG: Gfo/Idh/MocA family oxidoreductase [Candidatus Dormibacteraeota bacterium]|nr:Gfo/Idh/MocA family oxidoreductase [Candidatus Dormibacteraeota bacterium]